MIRPTDAALPSMYRSSSSCVWILSRPQSIRIDAMYVRSSPTGRSRRDRGVDERGDHGVTRPSGRDAVLERALPSSRAARRSRGSNATASAVDDLVGAAHESVERVHRACAAPWQSGDGEPV